MEHAKTDEIPSSRNEKSISEIGIIFFIMFIRLVYYINLLKTLRFVTRVILRITSGIRKVNFSREFTSWLRN